MKSPTNLENALYQNAVMGATSIKKLYPSVSDTSFKSELRNQFNEYKKQTRVISGQLKRKNAVPEKIPMVSKIIADADIRYNCIKDNSVSNLAKMMLQGTNMGIIKVTQALNNSINDKSSTISEAKSILSKEQKYAERLKSFL